VPRVWFNETLGKRGKLEIDGNYVILPEEKISSKGKIFLRTLFNYKGEINMNNNYY
jgi:hypothetical protein